MSVDIIPKNEFDRKPVEDSIKLLKMQHALILEMVNGATKQYNEYEEEKRGEFVKALRGVVMTSCQHERATWNPTISFYVCDKCNKSITTNYWLGETQDFVPGDHVAGPSNCTTEEDIAARKLTDAYFKEFPSTPFETDLCDHSGCY